jgi:hypothetical protein
VRDLLLLGDIEAACAGRTTGETMRAIDAAQPPY